MSLLDAAGVDFESGVGPQRIEWADIMWIGAFKRTTSGADVTCIWVKSSRGGFPAEFQSSDPEWDSLLDAIVRRLPGLKPMAEWFPPPLHPVVEINMQTVFERA